MASSPWSEFCGLQDGEEDDDCKIVLGEICTLFFLAALSSYHLGRRQNIIARNRVQLLCIHTRILAAFSLALVPPIRLYVAATKPDWSEISHADMLASYYQTIAMLVNAGFLLSLRSHGTLSSRGPLTLIIFWLILLVTLWPLAHPAAEAHHYANFALACVYGLSLLPTGKSRRVSRSNTAEEERQVLLGNEYIRFHQHPEENVLGPANYRSSLFSTIYFSWVTPLIRMGAQNKLQSTNDLFALPESISLARITEKFQQNIDNSKTLFQALHSSFGREFYSIGILRLIADTSGFAGPLLLGALLRSEFDATSRFSSDALVYAGSLFLVAMLASYCSVHFNWRISVVTVKMRIALVTAIFRKSLEARELRSAKPEVLNLMSTDTDRIVNSCISFHSFWSIPLQLVVTLYLLYTQVGAAFTAGLLFAIILIPINKYIAGKIGQLSELLMARKDERMMTTAEVIHGARQIKLNAWERMFIRKIEDLRKEEVQVLAKRKYLDALCVYFWATTPVLMCLLTFGVASLTGQELSASRIYASVALLNMLIGPLNSLPWVLNGLVEASVSLKRVQELIDLPNLDLSKFYHPVHNPKSTSKANNKPVVLEVKNASFEFFTTKAETAETEQTPLATNTQESAETPFRLSDISFKARRGDLVCITGSVGSGKSCLLNAIAGDMNCVQGVIALQDLTSGFGYVSQHAWLQRGTIRDNIVWGQVYDDHFYNRVVHACGLSEDMRQLGGDDTYVGDKGMTLSGGQRMRISLARAVYQQKQVYLLDDILSSLDVHVSSHVVKHCIFGLLANKTRLIVTSQRSILRRASKILHFDQGHATVHDSVKSFNYLSDDGDGDEDGDTEEYDTASTAAVDSRSFGIRRNSDRMADKPQLTKEQHSEAHDKFEERLETGTLKQSTLLAYWNAVSSSWGVAVIISVLLMQITKNYSDILLADWVAASTTPNDNSTMYTGRGGGELMGIYAGVVILNSVLTMSRAFVFAYAGIKAAIVIHNKLLSRVVFARFRFFDETPVGRIINRFSSDTYTVDDNLPFMLNILLAQVVGLFGALLTTLFALPWVTVVVVPLLPIYLTTQQRYRHASRRIKRLASNALSPLFSHFTETLEGLSTIRAMRSSARFSADFLVKLERSSRTQLSSSAAQCWLSIRLQMLGSFLIGGCSVVAALTGAHVTSAGYVGLAISYALSITNLLSGVLNAVAETELEMVAVERVNEYCQLECEDGGDGEGDLQVVRETPYGWPCQGVIAFNNVSLKYGREDGSGAVEESPGGGGNGDYSLKGVSFETEACDKIGVVGRTGAGKTSILSALLRTHEIAPGGSITLDSVPVQSVRLSDLRNRIAYVSQDPFLFRGTIRENLDPLNLYYESYIRNAMTKCLTAPLILSLGGLNGHVEMHGANLSSGQKQLLCLTRTFLKQAKVVAIDEGTARLDKDCEGAIQTVLRNAFSKQTVIQIAHRLENVRGMSRVLVMSDGQLVENDRPAVLEADPNSVFSQMLKSDRRTMT